MLRSPYCLNLLSCFFLLIVPLVGCAQIADRSNEASSSTDGQQNQEPGTNPNKANDKANDKDTPMMEIATFGGGCFWCIESFFRELKGVKSVKSGYMGGGVENPTYRQVCTGRTGHAEVVQIEYDPAVVSFDVLLQVFWKTHDPTTLNQQGGDHGTQYRSAVFYHSAEQKQKATDYKQKLNQSRAYPNPIVTEIVEESTFYVAEEDHQDFFNSNPENRYCQFVIQPKLDKFRKVFGDKLKKD